jgi:hypothetical protein
VFAGRDGPVDLIEDDRAAACHTQAADTKDGKLGALSTAHAQPCWGSAASRKAESHIRFFRRGNRPILPAMSDTTWEGRFRQAYDKAIEAYNEDGGRTPDECVSPEDQAFLASIGCTPQELYDFAEDWCWAKEPSFDEVLAVTAIRRNYFLKVQGGKPPAKLRRVSDFPPGTASLAGIPWLPRLIAKARAKLRGELPPQLMYGCGGDRPFLQSMGVGLAEFLAAVRDASDDDAIVSLLKRGGRA